jgi:hypothetical protein
MRNSAAPMRNSAAPMRNSVALPCLARHTLGAQARSRGVQCYRWAVSPREGLFL